MSATVKCYIVKCLQEIFKKLLPIMARGKRGFVISEQGSHFSFSKMRKFDLKALNYAFFNNICLNRSENNFSEFNQQKITSE